ncbi:acetylornithine deacetylase [Pseudophaeobacter arcticus]|uniref:acetylornithine deacetylase n=1 Tax=Pseudophaeobacter arcticus TaxID=385492 RepID=UPI003A96F4EE
MELRDRTCEILGDLIAFPTLSSDSNQALIAYTAGLLEDCGAKVDITSSPCGRKANLFATLGPEVDGGILLSGHSDVVPVTDQDWSSDPFVMAQREGRLYGRGACDMKGFIAATLALAPSYAAQVSARPIHFAFTYDEEVGCFGAQHLAADLQGRGLTPGVAIIGEPTEMRVIEGHKGCYEYSTHFHGLEGHGSAPDLGINAVEYAVRYVAELLQLKQRLRGMAPAASRFDPPWTTVNVGALQGGVAHNVIASKAQVDWEMRPVCASDADFVKTALRQLCENELLPEMRQIFPEADITLETIGEVAGLVPMEQNEARRIMAELTGANGADLVAFGTEAGIFQALGMDVVVCGPGSIAQAHKADEYLALDQLDQCLTVLQRLGGYL